MRTLQGHRWAVRALAYAPVGPPLLVSAGDDRSVRLWNHLTGECSEPLTAHGDSLTCLAFSPDGSLLASGGRSGSMALWKVAEGERLRCHSTGAGCVVAVRFKPDNSDLLLAFESPTSEMLDERLRICPVQRSGQVLAPPRLVSLPWRGNLESAVFAPDGRTAVLARRERSLEVWTVDGTSETPFAWLSGRIRVLALSPRSDLVAAATGRFIEIWDLNQRRRHVICSGHRGTVEALAFTPDGRTLLSGGADRTVRHWDVQSGRQQGGWDWQVGQVNALAVSPDGLTAAVGGDKPEVVVWDLDDE